MMILNQIKQQNENKYAATIVLYMYCKKRVFSCTYNYEVFSTWPQSNHRSMYTGSVESALCVASCLHRDHGDINE